MWHMFLSLSHTHTHTHHHHHHHLPQANFYKRALRLCQESLNKLPKYQNKHIYRAVLVRGGAGLSVGTFVVDKRTNERTNEQTNERMHACMHACMTRYFFLGGLCTSASKHVSNNGVCFTGRCEAALCLRFHVPMELCQQLRSKCAG